MDSSPANWGNSKTPKEKGRWKQITGHAKSVSDVSIGHLKVSFFGPFYASYVIFGLDHRNYQYAFVSGYNTNYLWLLSREPKVSDFVRDEFVVSYFFIEYRQIFATNHISYFRNMRQTHISYK